MTPDRTEHTPDEPENGVLSDTGSIDTTGLGILGGATAQVNVELPSESEDDLDDDDYEDDDDEEDDEDVEDEKDEGDWRTARRADAGSRHIRVANTVSA